MRRCRWLPVICIGFAPGACGGNKHQAPDVPTSHHTPSSRDTPSIDVGEQVTLLKDGEFGLRYFPDEGTSIVRVKPLSLLLTASDSSYLVEGPTLQQLSTVTKVLGPGGPGEFDNGYAGISAVVQLGRTYYGFYHAEDHEGLPALPGGIPGFYASIGVTRSDDGVTWKKLGQVITSSQPKTWTAYPNQGDRGAAEPGAIVSKDGRYLYLYYTEHSRVQGRGVDICVARAELESGPPLPGSFKKYYDGSFSEPGLGGRDTPVVTAKGFAFANALEGHVTYSKLADQYLMVFGIDAYQQRTSGMPATESGMYAAWSTDALSWSPPQKLIADQAVPQEGKSLSWEGSILFDDETGSTGTLVYGYTPSWGGTPHYMAGRRIRIRK
ncbi:MAG TPA: hypothetical protein VER11_18050 [Polyangiaceae bacterium]|nr:hypothetical protein [Polyangiaceae bacterium]